MLVCCWCCRVACVVGVVGVAVVVFVVVAAVVVAAAAVVGAVGLAVAMSRRILQGPIDLVGLTRQYIRIRAPTSVRTS